MKVNGVPHYIETIALDITLPRVQEYSSTNIIIYFVYGLVLLSRNDGKKGLRTVSNTVLCSNYPCSLAFYTRLFGRNNRSNVNAKIGLIGNVKLPYRVILIVVHPLVHVTLDSPRQHLHPQRYRLKTVRHHTVDTEYRVTDSKLRILRHTPMMLIFMIIGMSFTAKYLRVNTV
jgi:hypothetical protein